MKKATKKVVKKVAKKRLIKVMPNPKRMVRVMPKKPDPMKTFGSRYAGRKSNIA